MKAKPGATDTASPSPSSTETMSWEDGCGITPLPINDAKKAAQSAALYCLS